MRQVITIAVNFDDASVQGTREDISNFLKYQLENAVADGILTGDTPLIVDYWKVLVE